MRQLGVQIAHVSSIVLDINGNPMPKTPNLGLTRQGQIPGAVKVTFRIEHANEISFLSRPGLEQAMAKAAVTDPTFWAMAMQAANTDPNTKLSNLDRASMAAAFEALRIQVEKQKRGGRLS